MNRGMFGATALGKLVNAPEEQRSKSTTKPGAREGKESK
jgi:hypothetical protein